MTTFTDNLRIPHLDQNVAEPEIPENTAKDILDSVFSGQYVYDIVSADVSAGSYEFVQVDDVTSAQPWQNGIINITDTGVLLSGVIDIIVPDNLKQYIFKNSTLQNLNFKTTSEAGSGTTLSAGNNMYAIANGTGIEKLEFAASGAGTTFLSLSDTPSDYVGTYGSTPVVGLSENFLEFRPIASWKGPWATGSYQKNDLTRDGSWTMIANKDTSDRAAPLPIDEPDWIADDVMSWTDDVINDTYEVGIRISGLTDTYLITAVRFWVNSATFVDASSSFTPRIVDNSTGKVTYGDSFSGVDAVAEGWFNVTIDDQFVTPGMDITYIIESTIAQASYQVGGSWLTSFPSLLGHLKIGTGTATNTQNIYNIDLHAQKYTSSLDWDLVATSETGGGTGTGGSSTFKALIDTPSDYTGSAGLSIVVKATEDGLEFNAGGGGGTFLGLVDTPSDYTGNDGSVAVVNSAEDGIEFVTNIAKIDSTNVFVENQAITQANLNLAAKLMFNIVGDVYAGSVGIQETNDDVIMLENDTAAGTILISQRIDGSTVGELTFDGIIIRVNGSPIGQSATLIGETVITDDVMNSQYGYIYSDTANINISNVITGTGIISGTPGMLGVSNDVKFFGVEPDDNQVYIKGSSSAIQHDDLSITSLNNPEYLAQNAQRTADLALQMALDIKTHLGI